MTRALFVVVTLLACASVHAENLLDVYHQALARDPVWAAARANHRAGVERAIQGRAGLLPRADVSANVFENRQQLVTPTVDDTFRFSTDGYNVSATQPLYNPQNRALHAQGRAATEQAEHDLATAHNDLIVRVAASYLAVLAAADVHEYAASEQAAVSRLLALARRNFNVGAASLVDVHDAQAAYDLAVAQAIAAANELAVRREALRLLTGEPARALAMLKGDLDLTPPEPADMELWVDTTVAQNPQLQSLHQTVAVAEQEVERTRGARSPTLDLVAARTYNDSRNTLIGVSSETTTDQIGLQFQFPLYRGGLFDSNIRAATARLDEARNRLEAAQRQVAQQAREAYLAVINGIAQVRAFEQARASNQRALESTVLGSERGLRTGLDVLNNQRTLFRTLRDRARARYDYLLSRLRLSVIAGSAGEADLERINRLLE